MASCVKRVEQFSERFAKMIGKKAATRPEAVKLFWNHVKAEKLQDPKNGKIIHCSKEMKELFNMETIELHQVFKVVNTQIVKSP